RRRERSPTRKMAARNSSFRNGERLTRVLAWQREATPAPDDFFRGTSRLPCGDRGAVSGAAEVSRHTTWIGPQVADPTRWASPHQHFSIDDRFVDLSASVKQRWREFTSIRERRVLSRCFAWPIVTLHPITWKTRIRRVPRHAAGTRAAPAAREAE